MWNLIYIYTFCFSLILALIFTPLMRVVSRRLKIFDHPGTRKIHEEKMPILGGMGIYLAFVLTIGLNIIVLFLLARLPQVSDLVLPLTGSLSVTLGRLAAIIGGSWQSNCAISRTGCH